MYKYVIRGSFSFNVVIPQSVEPGKAPSPVLHLNGLSPHSCGPRLQSPITVVLKILFFFSRAVELFDSTGSAMRVALLPWSARIFRSVSHVSSDSSIDLGYRNASTPF